MEQEELLELALDFFGLERNFTEEEFRRRYHELAKKYHPDGNEFTSTVLFNELQKSKQILDEYLKSKKESAPHRNLSKNTTHTTINTVRSSASNRQAKDPAFELYKISKEKENRCILEYYEKTKGNPVFLKEEENPPLRELREKLREPIQNYKKILTDYPRSVWAMDAKDSIRRLSVWTRRDEGGED